MPALATARAPAHRPGDEHLSRAQMIALAALGAAYIVVRCWNLATFCLDSDEIFSLLCARQNLGGLLHAVRVDVVHPPFSYLLLWLWVRIGGESVLWVRLLPCLISIAALVPVWIIFEQLRLNAPARIVALALLAINDYQVFHARYVRMYALLFLLSLISVAIFLSLLEQVTRRRVIALAVVNLLLVYTHYYGWMVVGVEGLHLLLIDRRKLKLFVAGALGSAILFAPWAVTAAQAAVAKGGLAANLGWIRHPKIGDLWWYYAGCHGPLWPVPATSAMVLVLFVALGAGVWRVFRAAETPLQTSRLQFIALLAVFPPVSTYVLSNQLRNSVWGNRHLIVSAVPYMALLAASLIALRPKWVRVAVLTIATGWGLWGAYRVTLAPDPRNNMEVLTGQLVDLNARVGPRGGEPTVYLLDPYLSYPMRYFLDARHHRTWNLKDVASSDAVSGDRVWVGYNYKSWKPAESPEDLLRRRGYKIGPGVWAADHWDKIAVFLAYRDRRP